MIAITCPRCGPTVRLVEGERYQASGQTRAVWTCPSHGCSFFHEVPEDHKLRQAGAPMLPGLA